MVRRASAKAAAALGLLSLALWLSTSGACLQVSGLDKITIQQDAGGPVHCTDATACDDQNPCTTDTCSSEGVCVNAPVADGPVPDPAPTADDCQEILCTGGQPGMAMARTDGTPCKDMGLSGTCAGGKCSIPCSQPSDCTMGPPNPCVTPDCNLATGQCDFPPQPDGTPTPGVTPVPGDCHVHVCVGGVDTDKEDDTDLPAMMGDCQDPACNGGVPGQTPHPADAPCSTYMTSQPGFCDGKGACAQCTKDAECSGTSNDCEHPACTAGACGAAFTPSGTPTTTSPPQVDGDCQQIQCDGAGMTKMVADDTDLPSNASGCAPGTCTAGTPGHGKAPDGTPCGNGLACLNGTCAGCMTNAQCQPPAYQTCGGGGVPDTCGCTPTTCAAVKITCGSAPDACGGMLGCNNGARDGTETDVDCGGVAAAGSTCAIPCAQGKKCVVGSDCQSGLSCVDGVCCNAACTGTCQACSAAKKGQGANGVCGAVKLGTDPDGECPAQAASTCGRSGGCNGSGACSTYPNGTVCQGSTCTGGTQNNASTCAGGVCTQPSPPTTSCAGYLCAGAMCGSTCAGDTDCSSGYYCNVGAHQCLPKQGNGGPCTAADQCTSGACVTGVCCNTSCPGKCHACSLALTGQSSGTCAIVLSGVTDPAGLCVATPSSSCGDDGTCDGMGDCARWKAGTGCSSPSCAGGELVTATQCNGTGSCNMGLTMSSCPGNFACASMTACDTSCGTSDASCVSGYYCDGVGAGACQPQQPPGAPCTSDHQCQDMVCSMNNKCQ